jgi:signal transduction histidine kinase
VISLRSVNIRTRMAVWFAAILAGVLTVYIAFVFAFQYVLLERQIFHDEMQDVETVEGLLYFDPAGMLHLQEGYHSRPQSRLLEDRLMEVRDPSGVVLYRSETLHGAALGGALRRNEGATSYDQRSIHLKDGTPVLVISHAHPVEKKPVVIRLGYSLAPLHDRMLHFFFLLLLATPIGLLVAAFAGYSIARRALLPLDQMAARAEQITARSLNERIVVENPHDELGHMARALNRLLERLEQAFLQLQRFTADAAHELRTPLAALRTLGEMALDEKNPEAVYRETIAGMLEETARLNQTIESLLLLAKTETLNASAQSAPFSLPELVDEILAVLDVLLEERHIRVRQDGATTAVEPVRADRGLIRIALMNVLHNAIKFSPEDSTIGITYSHETQDGRAQLRVCIQDSGPGIAAGEHARIFERFFTSASPRTAMQSGAGLGLSITKLIVDRSDGEVFFEDRASNQGASCCIILPSEGSNFR